MLNTESGLGTGLGDIAAQIMHRDANRPQYRAYEALHEGGLHSDTLMAVANRNWQKPILQVSLWNAVPAVVEILKKNNALNEAAFENALTHIEKNYSALGRNRVAADLVADLYAVRN